MIMNAMEPGKLNSAEGYSTDNYRYLLDVGSVSKIVLKNISTYPTEHAEPIF